jgi:cell division protein FtsQ
VPNNNSGFFVDRNGVVIPNTIYKTNLVIATGDIDQTYATKELLPFANFIQDNDFWDNQIEQIHVTRNAENKRVIELVPRVGNHIVHMGSVSNYEKKLKRLKTFYDKAIGTVGWNKYETINIQYDNQIICTKHKN